MGSLGRLKNSLWNLLRNQELFENYDQVIQEKLTDGVVEKVSDEGNWVQQEFYLPRKAVVSENPERTKMQILYQESARERNLSLSQRDCLSNSVMWWCSKRISSDTNQERRFWRTKVLVGAKRRS